MISETIPMIGYTIVGGFLTNKKVKFPENCFVHSILTVALRKHSRSKGKQVYMLLNVKDYYHETDNSPLKRKHAKKL